MLGFINIQHNSVVLEIKIGDIDSSLKNDFFSKFCIFSGQLIIGMASGRIICLNSVDFSIVTSFRPY